jgi:hypothetical protein
MVTINGETITGIALSFLAILFIYAGNVNEVWAKILLADYFILVIGIAFIVLGVYSIRKHRTSHVKEFNINTLRNQRQFNINTLFMRNQRQFNINTLFMRNQRRIGESIMIAKPPYAKKLIPNIEAPRANPKPLAIIIDSPIRL